jgi:hypothetical protein
VSIRAFGEHRGDALRFAHDRPAQAEAHAFGEAGLQIAGLSFGHHATESAETMPFAIPRAAIEDHLIKAEHVLGG